MRKFLQDRILSSYVILDYDDPEALNMLIHEIYHNCNEDDVIICAGKSNKFQNVIIIGRKTEANLKNVNNWAVQHL